MSTSGSVNFTQTRNELIYDAFQVIGVYGVGRTISDEDMNFASNVLNKMIKSWGTKGLHLWTKEEVILFLNKDVSEYKLGSTAKACLASDAILTQLSAAAASAATSLSVDSTTGMAVSDVIGIVLSDNSVHYDTIATIPDSTSLTLTTGLSGAASNDAYVYTYTTAINKPLRVLDCRRVRGFDSGSTSTQNEINMNQLPYEDYRQMSGKTNGGLPSQWSYNPNRDYTSLYLWQRPTDGSQRMHLTVERIIEDLDNAGDNFDFPNEWLEALTWQLALRLCTAFGKDKRMLSSIAPMASSMLDNLLDWDSEDGSIQFIPDGNDYAD